LPAAPGHTSRRHHIQGDVRDQLGKGWDLAVFHPDCTYLCRSGVHWNKRRPGRDDLTEEALDFVVELFNAPIPLICLENPVGVIANRIAFGVPMQKDIVQPYEFGHDASKKTVLWLKGLPTLPRNPALRIPGRVVNGLERWANQTDSGNNRLPPNETRWQARSDTYYGIADAMAECWTNLGASHGS
jgi:hypothetical protein